MRPELQRPVAWFIISFAALLVCLSPIVAFILALRSDPPDPRKTASSSRKQLLPTRLGTLKSQCLGRLQEDVKSLLGPPDESLTYQSGEKKSWWYNDAIIDDDTGRTRRLEIIFTNQTGPWIVARVN